MCGNKKADKWAGSARGEGIFTLDAPTDISTIRDHLASSNKEVSYTKDLVVQKRVKYGEGRKSEMRDPARRYSNQLMIETVSMSLRGYMEQENK